MTAGEIAPHPPSSAGEEEFIQLSRRPGDSTVSRTDLQRDETVRRWGLITPSATRIVRADSPSGDLRRTSVGSTKNATQRWKATASVLTASKSCDSLTRCAATSALPRGSASAIGTMVDLDLTAFGSQRAIPKVALVVIRHVVDREREHHLGLHDDEWIEEQPPERLADLYDQLRSRLEYRA